MDEERMAALESRLAQMQRDFDALKSSISTTARTEAQTVLSTLRINGGQNIQVSGAIPNISLAVTIPQGTLQGSVQCVDGVGVLSGSVTF